MNFLYERDKIDAIVPGVTSMYEQLRASPYGGIYTSLGRYYNHTLFGRDSGMSAKFVSDFDHEAVWQTIVTLAHYQGQVSNSKTQEQPGRIHHELRDYKAWNGRWYDRFGLELAGFAWGMKNLQLCTYFAGDTTATYIRLINKYVLNIDRSIIDRTVPQQTGKSIPLALSIELAANWLCDQVDEPGLFRVRRTNRWSLPYQTFADSVTAYAWQDGRAADTAHEHSFIEVQAYAMDALEDAARLLPSSTHAKRWRKTADDMHNALFEYFWSEKAATFVPGVFERDGILQQLDTQTIASGWILNASFWGTNMNSRHRARLIALVSRLFADDFLTDVGIRTRSTRTREPLGATIDYHGSRTVWPMFNYMVIEGLRRHGLYRLARQLENRLLNGINAVGNFPEFMIIEPNKTLYMPDKSARLRRDGQMIPEQNIAFTVVPALTLAYRQLYKRHAPAKSGWQHDVEQSILATIPGIDLLPPAAAFAALSPTPLRIQRTRAGLRSALHIAPVILKKP